METTNVPKSVEIWGPNKQPKGQKAVFTLPDGKTQYYKDGDNFVRFDENINKYNETGVSGDGLVSRLWNTITRNGNQGETLLTGNELALARIQTSGLPGTTSNSPGATPPPVVSQQPQPTPAAQTSGPDPSRAVSAATRATGGQTDTKRSNTSSAEIAAGLAAQRQSSDPINNAGARVGSSLLPTTPSQPTTDTTTPSQPTEYRDAEASRRNTFPQKSRPRPYAPTPEEIETYAPRDRIVRVTSPPNDSPTTDSPTSLRPIVRTTLPTRAQEATRTSTDAEPTTRPSQRQMTESSQQRQATVLENKPRSILKQQPSSGDLTVQKQKKSIFVQDVSSFLDKAKTLASDKNTVIKGIHPSNKKPNIANIIIIIVGVISLSLILVITGSPPFHAKHASTKDVEKFYDIVKSNFLFPKNSEIPDNYGEHIMI